MIRCPICHATPSAADVELLQETGETLLVCPRDPWCWCSHAARDGEGLCELCGLVVKRHMPAPYKPRETAQARPTQPADTTARPKPRPTAKTCTEKTCGARVLFAETASGARMIVDADGCDQGNVVVRWDEESGKLRARVSASGMSIEPTETRHKTHFETCKNPNKFRKGKKK